MPELKLDNSQSRQSISMSGGIADKENLNGSQKSLGLNSTGQLASKLNSMSGVKLLNYIQSPEFGEFGESATFLDTINVRVPYL